MDLESHHFSSHLTCKTELPRHKCLCQSCQYNMLVTEQKSMKAFPRQRHHSPLPKRAKMETRVHRRHRSEFNLTAHKTALGMRDAQVAFNSLSGMEVYQPFDSVESHRQHATFKTKMGQLCASGNLEQLQYLFDQIRESSDPVLNRQSAWEQYESQVWSEAYGKGPHWHVIEWLARQPEIRLVPTKYGTSLPDLVADRAVVTGQVDELEKLLRLGWEINQCVARTVARENGGKLPSLR
jgi:hypothetical protein